MAKEEKVLEPAVYLSSTNIETTNYRVYYMSIMEKIIYSCFAFMVGAAVGYVFYGGLFKNEFGESTKATYICNVIICGLVGIMAVRVYLPQRTMTLLQKRKTQLKVQFRELLASLATSIGSGKVVSDAFISAYEDLQIIYSEEDHIIKELYVIKVGLAHNINIEEMLVDFGERSGLDDITSFANVFELSSRKGGSDSMKEIVHIVQQIIVDKMNVEMEIETAVSAVKMEQNIMLIMPVALVGLIKASSAEFAANFASNTGITATTIAVIMFVASYFIGKKILSIKV